MYKLICCQIILITWNWKPQLRLILGLAFECKFYTVGPTSHNYNALCKTYFRVSSITFFAKTRDSKLSDAGLRVPEMTRHVQPYLQVTWTLNNLCSCQWTENHTPLDPREWCVNVHRRVRLLYICHDRPLRHKRDTPFFRLDLLRQSSTHICTPQGYMCAKEGTLQEINSHNHADFLWTC